MCKCMILFDCMSACYFVPVSLSVTLPHTSLWSGRCWEDNFLDNSVANILIWQKDRNLLSLIQCPGCVGGVFQSAAVSCHHYRTLQGPVHSEQDQEFLDAAVELQSTEPTTPTWISQRFPRHWRRTKACLNYRLESCWCLITDCRVADALITDCIIDHALIAECWVADARKGHFSIRTSRSQFNVPCVVINLH